MAHSRPTASALFKEYAGPTALGIALALCMPVLGVAALLLRGALVAAVAVAVAIAAIVGVWRLVEPSLSPRWRVIIGEYAGPCALGLAMAACLPLVGIVALVAQGAVVVLLAAALVIGAIVGAWRLIVVTRHRPHD